MCMHERLGDTTYEEADEDVPNEVKHYFFLLTPDSAEVTRSNIRIAGQKLFKISSGNTRVLYRNRTWIKALSLSSRSMSKTTHFTHLALLADASYHYYPTADDHRHAAPCTVVRVAR